jgi:hypothetical protein
MNFLDIIHRRFFYLKQRFGDWTLPPSSGKKYTFFVPIDRAVTISSFRNVIKKKKRNRTMDNVQKVNNFINILS